MSIKVVVPVPASVAPVGPVQRAELPKAREGIVLGLVDNSKHNAREILLAVSSALKARGIITSHLLISKPMASRPITDAQREELLTRAHIVLTGVGD